MNKIADEIFNESQRNIVEKQIVDEGTLLKSGNINRAESYVEIIYSVPYADVVEYGRLPGSMPPFTPIFNWVKRKLRVKDDKEAKGITYAILNDIKKKGQMPRPFLSPAIQKARIKYKF